MKIMKMLMMLHVVICVRRMFKPNYIKVRDHAVVIGQFRSAAHQTCNINYFINRYLQVCLHYFKGYGRDLII